MDSSRSHMGRRSNHVFIRQRDMAPMTKRVLFVCLGNICRSPMAEHVFRDMVQREKLDIVCGSCGTAAYHVGEPPDRRGARTMAEHGIDCSGKRASRLKSSDYRNYDYIVCMDSQNLEDVRYRAPADATAEILMMMDFAGGGDVEDPWYTGDFERTYQEVSRGCRGLIEHISGSG